ncbi:hypothetical protein K458DRAFT_421992 [Lentithecium fluviatile CBS 122367]|uniref:Calcineurin-like phosphoesterase domain-containing protein n=1 Tax=Lentithecium fluviatile CBS 122367 TaxID=1168545 RepID=A0A6G1INY5_9PLEO|nr:hypothetical protein K458DRAFT_421992 [Lentithecium fluviatile CBS 122367]
MQLSRLLFFTALVATPLALLGTAWLFLYPLFNRACNFPEPPTGVAPFRLLALGDPQLEGDSSLPKPGAPIFPSLQYLVNDTRNAGSWPRRWYFVKEAGRKVPKDLLRYLEGHRKRIDLWGNDYYLGHIVRTLRWWTQPSHVAVLGDLLGSQWIKDEEFEKRTRRYWDIVMSGMEKVPESVMLGEGAEGEKRWGGTLEVLGNDKTWGNRVINIAGNHDIGYAGDIDEKRIERFERAFGRVNWDIVFTLPDEYRNASRTDAGATDRENSPVYMEDPPALRLVILNSMNLDTPAYVDSLQRESYEFMNHVISTSRSVNDKTHATILLTHIPFYKEAGICVDSPLFTFFEGGSGVKEQNMLSDYASKIMLEGIFGLSSSNEADGKGFGRRGIVLNGHDHEGCDVLHYITQSGVESQCPEDINVADIHMPEVISNASDLVSTANGTEETDAANSTIPEAEPPSEPEPPKWQALRFPPLPYKTTQGGECVALDSIPRIREITVRSMMGDFAGYAGFLSAWFDPALGEKGEWKLEFSTCGMGTQHWWWAVYVTDLILVVAIFGAVVARCVEGMSSDVEGSTRSRRRVPGPREKALRVAVQKKSVS